MTDVAGIRFSYQEDLTLCSPESSISDHGYDDRAYSTTF